MKSLIGALQFLTVLRLSKQTEFEPRKMLAWFPAIGMLVGALLACFDALACLLWEKHIVSLLDVVLLAWITGGLHLDGLGDTADGLYGRRPIEKALEIMKDSRVGAMGVLVIYFGLTVKWVAIGEMDAGRSLALVVIPSFGRAGLLFGTRFLAYGRIEGVGKDFFAIPLQWRSFSSVLLPVCLSLFLGAKGVLLIGAFFLMTGATILFYKKRLGCITGDMLGAMCESCEAGLFLVMAIGGAS